MNFSFEKKRTLLSDAELEKRFGRERLNSWSLAHFGSVMISDGVLTGQLVCDTAFREKPDMSVPFSGWTFFSSEAPTDKIEMHDCLAILRVAPEIAPYLDLPPGHDLLRSSDTTFTVEKDETP
jgi:hypothetical protein